MAKIGVVTVPYVLNEHHYIYMVQTVLSLLYGQGEHKLDLIAIVNGFQRPESEFDWLKKSFDLVEINERNNLAMAWNRGIDRCFERGNDYALVINLDLFFHSKFLDGIVAFAKSVPDTIAWSGTEWADMATLESAPLEGDPIGHAHFSCFMIGKDFFARAGRFDEQFEPAYHEDSDMLYRLHLLNLRPLATPAARFFHIDRATIKGVVLNNKDDKLLDELRAKMDESMERYKKKWGGLPGSEVFKTPYNT